MKLYWAKNSNNIFCCPDSCGIRKENNWDIKLWIKDFDWTITEGLLKNFINKSTYKDKKIVNTYASWHVFLNKDKTKVFLTTIQKKNLKKGNY